MDDDALATEPASEVAWEVEAEEPMPTLPNRRLFGVDAMLLLLAALSKLAGGLARQQLGAIFRFLVVSGDVGLLTNSGRSLTQERILRLSSMA